MKYDFDEIIPRRGTNSVKWDLATDERVLPMWVADMDFRTAPPVLDALERRLRHGVFGYTKVPDAYFEAVKGWFGKRHGFRIENEWILPTTGVIPALSVILKALTEPGDKVILQTPVYNCFFAVLERTGRQPLANPLIDEGGAYRMDFEDLERKAADPQAKLIFLCNPHNPVGRVWTKEELLRLGDICERYGVIVVSDEIHADFVFEGSHQVLAGLKESYRKFVVTCTAPSKTFNLAGLQVSNIFIPDDALRRKFEQAVAASGYSQLNTMGLVACEAAYRYGEEWYDAVKAYIRENLAYAQHFLEEQIPQVKAVKPEGTYLLWVDFRSLGLSGKELEDLIVKKAGLWLDSGDIFGAAGRGFERINVACPRSVLTEALERLACAVREKEPIVCK